MAEKRACNMNDDDTNFHPLFMQIIDKSDADYRIIVIYADHRCSLHWLTLHGVNQIEEHQRVVAVPVIPALGTDNPTVDIISALNWGEFTDALGTDRPTVDIASALKWFAPTTIIRRPSDTSPINIYVQTNLASLQSSILTWPFERSENRSQRSLRSILWPQISLYIPYYLQSSELIFKILTTL